MLFRRKFTFKFAKPRVPDVHSIKLETSIRTPPLEVPVIELFPLHWVHKTRHTKINKFPITMFLDCCKLDNHTIKFRTRFVIRTQPSMQFSVILGNKKHIHMISEYWNNISNSSIHTQQMQLGWWAAATRQRRCCGQCAADDIDLQSLW